MAETNSIDEIRKIAVPIAQKYGVKKLALFGSYARGEQKNTSDIDFLVEKGEIKGFFRLAGFQRELEENFSVSVDVLTTGALSDEFLNRIKNEVVTIYER
jgi:Predicted nucleotidyltransferases